MDKCDGCRFYQAYVEGTERLSCPAPYPNRLLGGCAHFQASKDKSRFKFTVEIMVDVNWASWRFHTQDGTWVPNTLSDLLGYAYEHQGPVRIAEYPDPKAVVAAIRKM
jgi:hypothetical protein